MSLTLRLLSEYDVAKVIDSLVECAEHRRAEGDEVGERMLIRLADKIEDCLTAVAGEGFASRVAQAREQQREVAAERRRLSRTSKTVQPR